MKKLLVVFVAIMLAFSLFAITGCGDDTAKAKEYKEAGDKHFQKTWKEWERWENLLGPIISAASNPSEAEASKIAESELSALGENLDQMVIDFKRARQEYNEILALSGVEDYKSYAEKMIEVIESTISAVETSEKIYTEISSAIDDYKKTNDMGAIGSALMEVSNDIVKFGTDSVKAGRSLYDAEKIEKTLK